MPTPNQIVDQAKAVIDAARLIKSAIVIVNQVLDHNSVNDPGWSTLDGLPVSPETGIIDGTEITPMDVNNAIGSLTQFRNVYTGAAGVTQSAWGNNIEKVVKPIV